MRDSFKWSFVVIVLAASRLSAAEPDCAAFTYKPNGTLLRTTCSYFDPTHGRIGFEVNLSTPQITINAGGDITNAATFRASVRTAYLAEVARKQAEKTAADAVGVERAKITVRVRESDLQ